MDKQLIKGRRYARKMALQALYQWQLSGVDRSLIEAQYKALSTFAKVDEEYFCRLLHGVIKQVKELEAGLIPFLDRNIEELTPIERTVLRLSAFELNHCPEVPYKVVLDESVVLTRAFGAEEGYRYVNGVLNQLAQVTRTIEIGLDKHE